MYGLVVSLIIDIIIINKAINTNNEGEDNDLETLLAAFSAENRNIDFDWNKYYSKGYDITCFNST